MAKALSIYLARWPVRLAQRKQRRQARTKDNSSKSPSDESVLIVASQRGKQIIAACCEQAVQAGVRAGITLAHARAILNDRRILEAPHSPEDDERSLQRLARWALHFAPTIAADPPDGLLLDITGCERLFGGTISQVRAIDAALQRVGLPSRIAAAPTFGSAWAMARYGPRRVSFVDDDDLRERLAPLPVAALRIDDAARIALSEIEVQTIGELLAIPRRELAARYGAALLLRIDQAYGDIEERIEPIRTPPVFVVGHTFEGPVRRSDFVFAAIERLLDDLLAMLAAHDHGLCELSILFDRVDAGPLSESFCFSRPTRDRKHLWALIHLRLDRLRLGCGVEEITLRGEKTERMQSRQIAMWQGAAAEAPDDASLGRLLDRLTEKLGNEAVLTASPFESYLPEKAFGSSGGTATKKPVASVLLADRPSRLFPKPEAIDVMAAVPDGPPAWMKWRGDDVRIIASAGPERIALPWWTGEEAMHAARDYYIVCDARGRTLWIYRACEEGAPTGEWFIHGVWV
ncbi:MAG: DNA polymerase Y family protein [Phycisphaerales bacterium]|nr:DNA polymerase Y family protein [Phycisphaerales bacterium]MCB9863445.1 DNA polymerase Y family protein [Phycisphaerales bacterium]